MTIIKSLSPSTYQPIKTPQDIDEALDWFTTSFLNAVNDSAFIKNRTFKNALPPEIIVEIETKNRIRREW